MLRLNRTQITNTHIQFNQGGPPSALIGHFHINHTYGYDYTLLDDDNEDICCLLSIAIENEKFYYPNFEYLYLWKYEFLYLQIDFHSTHILKYKSNFYVLFLFINHLRRMKDRCGIQIVGSGNAERKGKLRIQWSMLDARRRRKMSGWRKLQKADNHHHLQLHAASPHV